MKRIIALTTALVLIIMFVGCNANNNASQTDAETKAAASTSASKVSDKTTAKSKDTDNSGKTLVAYFSATGTTKGVAELIANVKGADIYEITAAKPYTSEDLDYNNSDSRATKEQNDDTARPEIGSKKINLDGYNTIYIGFPIWWGIAAWPVDTFVKGNDFTGKTVLPVATSAASPLAKSGELLKAMAKGGDWKAGIRFASGASDKEVADWAKKA